MNLALLLNRGPRSLFRRRPGHPPPQPAPTRQPFGVLNISGSIHQFTAARIRTAFFPTVRRGYHPESVRHLLDQVADEITRLNQRIAAVYAENDHIKRTLKQWQTDHARTCRRTDPDTRTHWPVNRS